jgi:hypothetical protein
VGRRAGDQSFLAGGVGKVVGLDSCLKKKEKLLPSGLRTCWGKYMSGDDSDESKVSWFFFQKRTVYLT